jgi:hypothetical protein
MAMILVDSVGWEARTHCPLAICCGGDVVVGFCDEHGFFLSHGVIEVIEKAIEKAIEKIDEVNIEVIIDNTRGSHVLADMELRALLSI